MILLEHGSKHFTPRARINVAPVCNKTRNGNGPEFASPPVFLDIIAEAHDLPGDVTGRTEIGNRQVFWVYTTNLPWTSFWWVNDEQICQDEATWG